MYIMVWLGMWYKKCNIFDKSLTSEKDGGKFYKSQNLRSWEWRELEIINKKTINKDLLLALLYWVPLKNIRLWKIIILLSC